MPKKIVQISQRAVTHLDHFDNHPNDYRIPEAVDVQADIAKLRRCPIVLISVAFHNGDVLAIKEGTIHLGKPLAFYNSLAVFTEAHCKCNDCTAIHEFARELQPLAGEPVNDLLPREDC